MNPCLWLLLLVVAAEPAAALKPVPINVAEAIIEPFWTPELSGLAKWRVEPGAGHGLRIRQNWSAVDFEWASKPQAGPALRMTRDFGVDCSGYDRLLVRLSLPKGCVLRVLAQTDKGLRTFVSEPASEIRAEYVVEQLDLADGDKHNRIAIRKDAVQGELEVAIGLQPKTP
ncbi:MAG TPA: hypothetical protein VLI39_21635 [Sedimentisphaerales bacterium]|nr:hypothetical protein [Sedimentisphaerales bacterium]